MLKKHISEYIVRVMKYTCVARNTKTKSNFNIAKVIIICIIANRDGLPYTNSCIYVDKCASGMFPILRKYNCWCTLPVKVYKVHVFGKQYWTFICQNSPCKQRVLKYI